MKLTLGNISEVWHTSDNLNITLIEKTINNVRKWKLEDGTVRPGLAVDNFYHCVLDGFRRIKKAA